MEDDPEDVNHVSRMTYVKAPVDEPLNLDMSAFDKVADTSAPEDSSKRDLEVINQCMERHQTFNSLMQRRAANIKVVMNYLINQ